ncbi:hypothetical protein EH223_19780 [candidate division KSB1 bacterium]|nr:hypothetical protein [candidate division KSB1 bacterium]RQW00184.1 MAG: hypothetical protein EH223_19780 [candidate division KSB1 bacterium]
MKKILFFLFPLLIAGCSQRELPQQPGNEGPMSLKTISVPEVLNPGDTYRVSVQLTGASDVDSVGLDVYKEGESNIFTSYALFDDGGKLHPNDGDQVAFDGYFSQNVVWTASGNDQSNYMWHFTATDVNGRTSEPLQVTVLSRKNNVPVLLTVATPDTMPSGFEGELFFRAQVSDSNGFADIDRVIYSAYQDNALIFTANLESESEGVYTAKMDKYYAVGKKGLYDLRFKAIDKSGGESNIISKNVYVGNNPPQLLDFVHVDSVRQPVLGYAVSFLITVRVQDDQSLLEVSDVLLEWKKPNGKYSENSPFDLYDNGLPWNEDLTGWNEGWRGDETAGDGIYSITGILNHSDKPEEDQPLGDYELTFFARDFAGNTSERVTRIITYYAEEGN